MNKKNNFVKQTGKQNPLDGINLGDRATPKLVDFDGDGDLDLFVGNEKGTINYLKNEGNKHKPEFVQQEGAANPFDRIVIDEERSNPALADLDGDGVIDTAVVGNKKGELHYFTSDGSRFIEKTGSDNPFDGVDVGSRSAPEWADINGDGKLDLIVGEGSGKLNLFLNNGTSFESQTNGDNPFDGIDVGNNSTPTLRDIDGDGDLDAFVGTFTAGNVNYFENTGTVTNPKYVERIGADNPFNNVQPITGNTPTLGDIDGDGDLDAFVGDRNGNINFLANTPSVSIAAGNITPTEKGKVGFFAINLSEPAPRGGLTINYTVEARPTSATAGVDYESLSGTVTITEGETTGKIEIIPIDDREKDSIKTVNLSLSSTSNGYLIDSERQTAYLAIADDEGNSNLAKILNEPNFKDQWYLYNTVDNFGPAGVDINALKVWEDYSGKGVKVGVVERGVDTDHPDLVANYDPTGPVGQEKEGGHGTQVSGIIAAEAGNGIGGVGVAFDSTFKLFDRRDTLEEGSIDRIEEVISGQVNVDVSNNSWGRNGFVMDFRKSGDPEAENSNRRTNYVEVGESMKNAAENGRNGLGTVFVSSAGNERKDKMSANYSNLRNSRYTIAVASMEEDGTVRSSSSPGANLLISAFGDDIFTTDVVGKLGKVPGDYNPDFGGTSSAAPMVTGVVALMLEANPNLGYRDVQEILAYSAKWTDKDNKTWGFNGANNWNGGGLHYSSDYGFGQVDTLAAVRLAETWNTQHTAANEQKITVSSTAPISIPDNNSAGVNDTLTVEKGVKIDRVEIDLEINHERYEDLIVTLTSPTGVTSELVNRVPRNDPGEFSDEKYLPNEIDGKDFLFTFSSTFDWGETGVGDWTLNVVDAKTGDTGVVKNWSLNLYGDTITPDDTYIYTNDFANDSLNNLAGRQTLNDTNGGKDIINAAAVSSDLILDLRQGKTSTIAGRSVTIGANTKIEQAFGGDGNDQIWGNNQDNILNGGRGDDRLVGNLGSNTLTGGDGNNTFVFTQFQKNAFDTITDFKQGDLLDFSSIIKASGDDDDDDDEFEFDDHFQLVRYGSGTKIQFNASGDDDDDDGAFGTIAFLDNVDRSQLSAKQFIV